MTGRRPIHRAAAGTLIVSLAVMVLAADQFTKHLVLENLTEGKSVLVLGEALQWRLAFNPGAAFSLGEGVTWIFTIALGLVALGILFLAFSRVHARLWAVVLGALLGGVLGNLTDRLFREPGFPVGHVVDFIYTPWMMPAIYNVADIFIVTSMISVALLVLIGLKLDGTREQSESRAKPETEADADADADGDAARDAPSVQRTQGDIVFGELDADDLYVSRSERRARRAAERAEAGADSGDGAKG